MVIFLKLVIIPAVLTDRMVVLVDRLPHTVQQATTVHQATTVRPDLMDLMAHEEFVALLRPVAPQDHMVPQRHMVPQSHMVQRDPMDHPARQAVDHQVAACHAECLVVHTVPQVLMDRTHQVDPTYGSFCRCVQSGGSAVKLEFRKRHLVTSHSG
ncbi:MAG: hypothetical protein H7Z17_05680 [Fuerstia sp.]|nr:hypothetical protein [Fuerstiella sp.]